MTKRVQREKSTSCVPFGIPAASPSESRCTGRKVASPSLVLRGSVRIVAGLATRQRAYSAQDLSDINLDTWRKLRAGLEVRRQSRTLRRRFRRDHKAYLHQLEEILLKPSLPT